MSHKIVISALFNLSHQIVISALFNLMLHQIVISALFHLMSHKIVISALFNLMSHKIVISALFNDKTIILQGNHERSVEAFQILKALSHKGAELGHILLLLNAIGSNILRLVAHWI